MNTTQFINIGFGLILTLIFVFGLMYMLRWLKRKDHLKIRANFIYEDRTITIKSYYNIVDTLTFDDLEYDYDDNVTIKKKGIKNIFYRIGQRKPLDFQNKIENDLTYSDFKKIIKSKVLNDLLDDEENSFSKAEMMLLFAIIITGLFILGFLWFKFQQPVEMLLNDATKDFIKESVLEAIRG